MQACGTAHSRILQINRIQLGFAVGGKVHSQGEFLRGQWLGPLDGLVQTVRGDGGGVSVKRMIQVIKQLHCHRGICGDAVDVERDGLCRERVGDAVGIIVFDHAGKEAESITAQSG